MAPSFASAPLLAKKTRSSAQRSVRPCANSSWGRLWKAGLGVRSFDPCAASASRTTRGACPRQFTAQPWTKSR